MWCVIFYSYGEWKITCPFVTKAAAERHMKDILSQRDYIDKDKTQVIFIKEMV